MSGGFRLLGGLVNPKTLVARTFASITAAGSTNTKGSYTQLIASTAADIVALLLQWADDNNSTESWSLDLAIGAGGSEKIILADIVTARIINATGNDYDLLLPLNIPAGTRVAARCQCSVASKALRVGATGFDGDFTQSSGISQFDTYGTSTSGATTGTNVTPANGSKGSYAQLTASLTNDIEGFFLTFCHNASGSSHLYLDIAVGAGGSEKIIFSDLIVDDFGANQPSCTPFFPIKIPAGTRVAARAQGQGTTAFPMCFYGAR